VEITDADGLRNIGWMGMSRPYCMVQIAGKGDRWLRWRTEPHEDWEEPKQHHERQVVCQPEDLMRSSSG